VTAKLAPPFPLSYVHAASKDEFFGQEELETIEKYEKREQPPVGTPCESCSSDLFFGDELWVLLQYRGINSTLLRSQRHLVLLAALGLANSAGIDELGKIRWSSICMRLDQVNADTIADQFSQWLTTT
jgi:hypothetical protein